MTASTETQNARKFEVGQRYREEHGYLWDVVAVEPDGAAWCRHPNTRGPATYTHPGWASAWDLVAEPDQATNREDGCP